jgi:magnesium chelatase family protein
VRFLGSDIYANAQMQSKEIKKYCVLGGDVFEILKTAIEKLNFSARFYEKKFESFKNNCGLGRHRCN